MKDKRPITSVPLKIDGSFGLVSKSVIDARGTLTRIWENSLLSTGFSLNQASIVSNPTSLTLRGLHYQKFPYSETKIIQCISGKVFDVILDLRKESNTYGKHITLEIGPSSIYQGLVVPSGCAHGYITLEVNSTLIYFMDNVYSAQDSFGVLWNDPRLAIEWPFKPVVISKQDLEWPGLELNE
jgi:dTDP-4-dehydrorhamnose 3,5-epimerase